MDQQIENTSQRLISQVQSQNHSVQRLLTGFIRAALSDSSGKSYTGVVLSHNGVFLMAALLANFVVFLKNLYTADIHSIV